MSELVAGARRVLKMSKATLSTEFRQVDVDELDEEKFVDEPDTTGVQGDDEDDQISQREQEVKKLSQGYPFILGGGGSLCEIGVGGSSGSCGP